MKCNNCGFEYGEEFAYCPNCGAKDVPPQQEGNVPPINNVSINPAADKILWLLNDKLFFTICVLMTVSCGCAVVVWGAPIISVLITIFLWLTYSDAKKGIANVKHLQGISGTVYANYILGFIGSGILVFVGMILFLFGFVVEGEEMLAEIYSAIEQFNLTQYGNYFDNLSATVFVIVVLALAGTLIFMAIIGMLINIFGMKKIHCFTKSVYQGIMYRNHHFQCVKEAKTWIIVFGVCDAITNLSAIMSIDLFAIASAGCSVASAIIAAKLIDKHLIPKTYY